MPRKATIRFDTDEIEDISDELIEVDKRFFTKQIQHKEHSLRFSIPTQIKLELDLHAHDICYFCEYSDGFYLSFKHKPVAATKNQIRSRKLSAAGAYNTLYLIIPPMIKKLYREPLKFVKLIQPKGYPEYEWLIQFHSTECT